MRCAAVLTTLTCLSIPALAAVVESPGEARSTNADLRAARDFVRALREDRRALVAGLVQYPLLRRPPLAAIHSPEEFLAHYGEYLDSTTIRAIVGEPVPETVGWRGTMIANGLVWFDGKGKIRSLNVRTPAAERALREAQAFDWARLHPTARSYSALEIDCITTKHRKHIRVERFGNSFRYFAWARGASITDKPELIILGGTLDVQGSIGSSVFTFESNGYIYIVDDVPIAPSRAGSSSDSVSVDKDGRRLFREDCVPIRR